jgi:hypothetical protein
MRNSLLDKYYKNTERMMNGATRFAAKADAVEGALLALTTESSAN